MKSCESIMPKDNLT